MNRGTLSIFNVVRKSWITGR